MEIKDLFIDDINTGYKVKNDGTILSKKGKPMTKIPKSDGYIRHCICYNGIKKYIRAHQIVWLVFNGIKPEHLVINHIDGIPTNNNINNLEIVTQSENIIQGHLKGNRSKKLTVEQATQIIELRRYGLS